MIAGHNEINDVHIEKLQVRKIGADDYSNAGRCRGMISKPLFVIKNQTSK